MDFEIKCFPTVACPPNDLKAYRYVLRCSDLPDKSMGKMSTFFMYLTRLNRWVSEDDGSFRESKMTARVRILNFLMNVDSKNIFLDQSLDLSGLGLCSVPPLYKISNLMFLNLSFNNIEFLNPSLFLNNQKLIKLDLSNNRLNDFKWLSENPSNVDIDLTDNLISLRERLNLFESQFVFDYQGPFYKLDLILDKFSMVHDSFGKEVAIKSELFHDYMGSLSTWLESEDGSDVANKAYVQSKILEFLNLSPLDQSSFSLCFLSLYSMPPLNMFFYLDTLDLSCNFISELSVSFLPQSKCLKKIILNHNHLSDLSPHSFVNMLNLECIDLSFNRFIGLRSYFFSDVRNLKDLSLSSNFLTNVEADVFDVHPHLRWLNLSNNFILSLPRELFRLTTELFHLDLSDNSLTNFEWFSRNPARCAIFLTGNLFSLDTISDLNAIQNVDGYNGPTYFLSIFEDSSLSVANVTFDSFPQMLQLWGGGSLSQLRALFLNTSSVSDRNLYNNLNIFLHRLFNDTPRSQEGDIPDCVQLHVRTILSILDRYVSDVSFLKQCSYMAFHALGSCIDRIGMTLITLSLFVRQYDAEKSGDVNQEKKFRDALRFIERVIKFVNDVHERKVIFDSVQQVFLPVADFRSDKLTFSDRDRLQRLGNESDEDREFFLIYLKEKGCLFRTFKIGDQIEDVLLIVNAVKDAGLLDIEGFDMRFGRCATLRDYLPSVILYLKS